MKKVRWIADSKEELADMPAKVKGSFGHRLWESQKGKVPYDTKPLFQLGRGLYEMRESYDTNAYRLMYVAHLENAIYVLDVFMKKSKSGIGLPKSDAERIKLRLKTAIALDKEKHHED